MNASFWLAILVILFPGCSKTPSSNGSIRRFHYECVNQMELRDKLPCLDAIKKNLDEKTNIFLEDNLLEYNANASRGTDVLAVFKLSGGGSMVLHLDGSIAMGHRNN